MYSLNLNRSSDVADFKELLKYFWNLIGSLKFKVDVGAGRWQI